MASQYEKRKSKSVETPVQETGSGSTPAPNYDRVGFDIFREEGTGKFLKVSIEYDLTTGAARVRDVKPIADSLPRAVQESQKVFVNKLMGIKGD